jgi:hypothetical protein
MSQSSDFKDLLRLLNENDARYLIVGGYAVAKYTEPRYTKDLDIWVAPDPQNAKAVFKALVEFQAPLHKVTEGDFTNRDLVYKMGVSPTRIDIIMEIDGVDFESAWGRRVNNDFDGVPAGFISKEDLITAKQATGRPRDLADVRNLQKSLDIDIDIDL